MPGSPTPERAVRLGDTQRSRDVRLVMIASSSRRFRWVRPSRNGHRQRRPLHTTRQRQVETPMTGRPPRPRPPSSKTREVGGVTLHLSTPDTTDQSWIGQDAILRQLLACWLVVDPRDLPLSPRLTGPPGIGKTTLAMAAARAAEPAALHQPVHGRHAPRRPDRHARPRRERDDRLPRLAPGHGHARRRRLRARRGEPDEREVVGQPGPAARPPPLCREHRGRDHHPRPSRFPRLRHDERGRVDLRGPRLHPLAAPADPDARASPPATTRWRSSSTTCRSPRTPSWP